MKAAIKLLNTLMMLGFIAIMLSSCEPAVQNNASNTERIKAYDVKKLFTVDGITVYSFYNNGEHIYFTNKTGRVEWEKSKMGGKCHYTDHYQVECNGD